MKPSQQARPGQTKPPPRAWAFYSSLNAESSGKSGRDGQPTILPTTAIKGVENLGTAVADVLDAISSERKIGDEVALLSTFKPLLKALKGVEGFQIFSNLVFGSVEGQRHKEIMDAFKQVNESFYKLEKKIEGVEARLTLEIWDSEHTGYKAALQTVADTYTKYINLQANLADKNESCNNATNPNESYECQKREEELIKAFEDKIKDNANAIKSLVKKTAPLIADAVQNCGDIVVYKAKITDILTRSYLAFDLGCALDFS